jgi:16S rRNA (adenine1518-N6/adenine1519-N6)-dimethyltransferase
MRDGLKGLLKKYNISPNKELGQCFLVNWNLLQKEVSYANVGRKDVVLEIGPGIGNLTELLAQRAKQVIAIEKDLQFRNVLSELQAKYNNVNIIYGDALEVDFPNFNKVVSNLPFKVALPLIFKILKCDFSVAVLLCQERLAFRICAKPGQKGYSRLSVQISRLGNVEILKMVPKSAFVPPPEVNGAIIKIKKTKPKFKVPSDDFFKEVLKFMFSQRDKTVQETILILKSVGVSKRGVNRVLSKIEKKIRYKRIYTVKPHEFGKVTWALWNILGDVRKAFYRFYKTKGLYKNS